MKRAIKRERLDPIVQDEPLHYGARPSDAKACIWCKHQYIKPCTEKSKERCPNYQHLKEVRRGKTR